MYMFVLPLVTLVGFTILANFAEKTFAMMVAWSPTASNAEDLATILEERRRTTTAAGCSEEGTNNSTPDA
jgi:hypothetical protein